MCDKTTKENEANMSRNHPSKPFISKRNKNHWTNGDDGNQAVEAGITSATEYFIHEITIIGNRPTVTSTTSNVVDTVDQRMLLMDKGNGLNNIIEKLQVSMGEQIFPEVKSDDEYINSGNNTARSSKSSSRLPMESPQNASSESIVNENSWTIELPKPIFIEKLFDSENDMKSSDDDGDQTEEIGAAVATMHLSNDTGEPEIEGESERKIEATSMDNTIQKSSENEMEKQLNEKSPTDKFYNRQFLIENGNDSEKYIQKNEYTTITDTTTHKNGFKKSSTDVHCDDVEMPDALMDLILNSLLDDCLKMEKSENDACIDEVKNSQIQRELLELALESILKDEEMSVDDLNIPIPESWSTDRSSKTPDIGTGKVKLNS